MRNSKNLVFIKSINSRINLEFISFNQFFNMVLIEDDEVSQTQINNFNIKYIYIKLSKIINLSNTSINFEVKNQIFIKLKGIINILNFIANNFMFEKGIFTIYIFSYHLATTKYLEKKNISTVVIFIFSRYLFFVYSFLYLSSDGMRYGFFSY